jgi:hypothetical protein
MMLQPDLLTLFSTFCRLQLVAMLNAFLIRHQLTAINRGIRSKGSSGSHQSHRIADRAIFNVFLVIFLPQNTNPSML